MLSSNRLGFIRCRLFFDINCLLWFQEMTSIFFCCINKKPRCSFLNCVTKGWFVCACSYLSYTCNTLPLHTAHSEFSTFALMRIYWWFSPRRTLANTEERCLDYSSWQSYLSSKIHLKQHLTMTALKFLVDIRNF